MKITFAHTSFKWTNLASHNAGVTVAIIALENKPRRTKLIFSYDDKNQAIVKEVQNINAYLVLGPSLIVEKVSRSPSDRALMVWGNKPTDAGNFFLNGAEFLELIHKYPESKKIFKTLLWFG